MLANSPSFRSAETKLVGLGWIAFVLLVLGGLYLYQRGGGKIFGPDGIITDDRHPRAKQVAGVEAKFESGPKDYELILTNKSSGELTDIDMTIVLFQEDGQTSTLKRVWAGWPYLESKKIDVPPHPYQKVTIEATAKQNQNNVKINESWLWTWGKEKK